ncbi:nitrile hydratase accessory protein [Candidatus Spongiihabitans sp.]|uniref:nitrile hydratase accessory protein n=1 Tax=Candidatus Spongiihabitans sp. TaxID=3101308 RepID=UPI003C7AFD60
MSRPEPIPGQPRADGELVFAAPWQARTFAMAVQLNQSGLFEWKEWAALLASNIAEFEQHNAIEDSDTYYRLWQQTLEQIVAEKTEL